MSVINDFQVNGLNPSIVGGTGTSAKYWPRLLGASIGVQSVAPSSTSAAGQLVVPGNSSLNGQLFSVKAAGNFIAGTSAGSETVTIALSANTGTVTSPTYTVIGTSTAYAPPVDNVEHSFALSAQLYGDSASGVCGGSYSLWIDGVLNNSTPKQTTALSSINFANTIPFGLVMSITFSVSNSANSASLYQFQITQE